MPYAASQDAFYARQARDLRSSIDDSTSEPYEYHQNPYDETGKQMLGSRLSDEEYDAQRQRQRENEEYAHEEEMNRLLERALDHVKQVYPDTPFGFVVFIDYLPHKNDLDVELEYAWNKMGSTDPTSKRHDIVDDLYSTDKLKSNIIRAIKGKAGTLDNYILTAYFPNGNAGKTIIDNDDTLNDLFKKIIYSYGHGKRDPDQTYYEWQISRHRPEKFALVTKEDKELGFKKVTDIYFQLQHKSDSEREHRGIIQGMKSRIFGREEGGSTMKRRMRKVKKEKRKSKRTRKNRKSRK